ncbi:MAG: trypsin-like peptidase domain-containing protein [Planctomycetes bacterium]|nr:trypsin-like peptidase domain-containing protein [Planctomycetota bacterium]
MGNAETQAERLRAYARRILQESPDALKRLQTAVDDAAALEVGRGLESPAAVLEVVRATGARTSVRERRDLAVFATQKVLREEPTTHDELAALEAIVLPQERPVLDVRKDSFGAPPAPWSHFADAPIRTRIEAAIPSVGRIELPDHPTLPYGGTGFVVGPGLVMTNRHVAEIFALGLGRRGLSIRFGQSADVDFKRERDSEASRSVQVCGVKLIHPYWDMAILEIPDLTVPYLTLDEAEPKEATGREVAVVGYPSMDPRNDLALQLSVFGGVFQVKRLQPGKLRGRAIASSFGRQVDALAHDSSTLGGNSGSAVIDVGTGRVVGLHFGGRYLVSNYAVPAHELARDGQVVDAGVKFGSPRPAQPNPWAAEWAAADGDLEAPVSPASGRGRAVARITVPLEIRVSLGPPAMADAELGVAGISVSVTAASRPEAPTVDSSAPSGVATVVAAKNPTRPGS